MRFILVLLCLTNLLNAQAPIFSPESIHHPIIAENGMVATQHHIATEVGLQILKDGGNAIDAAVAVGFALAVVLPRAGNLGGGGFMIVHKNGKTKAINYREKAPQSAHRDMYLDKDGNVYDIEFNNSYNAAGVPGTVAGMLYALKTYGTMTRSEVLAPAIKLAKEGFSITYDLSNALMKYEERLKVCQITEKIFYNGEDYWEAGDTLVQKDLAWSLEEIKRDGKAGFYKGPLAERLIEGIQSNGGIMTKKDLADYRISETEAIWGEYRGHRIASMPPPSSGGVHLIQMLNILEGYDLKLLEHNSAETIHLLVEAMRLAYADRSKHLGDPTFWSVPTEGIISKSYALDLRRKINSNKANLSDSIKPGRPQDYESEETTHFSVVDREGNAVSNTYTLNFSFGSGLMAEGTGILLNNEMGDFSAKPGTANAYGLIGGEANAVEPKKTPLSSMTPAIVFRNKKPYIITGSPGGSRIITTVLQLISNIIDHNMNVAEATNASRIHHQWYPDLLYYEKYLNPDSRKLLKEKGHQLKQRPAMGSTQTIVLDNDRIMGASDPRRADAKTNGY